MILTKIQSNKVYEIIDEYDSKKSSRVDFKAPTGSGKTLMATHVISQLIEKNPSDNFVFVIATLSSSELPQAFEQKINFYKKDLPFNKFEVEYIEAPSKTQKSDRTVRLIPVKNKVYIFGKASFGEKRIFTEQGVIEDFLYSCRDLNFKIIYIRDEAHYGGRVSVDEIGRKFEKIMLEQAHFVLHMTATPDSTSKPIILTEKELNDPDKNENTWLLKTTPVLLLKKDLSDSDLLFDAVSEFKKIKNEYKKLELDKGIVIRPALLIQVDNESANNKEFQKNLSTIKTVLTENSLAWAQYFGNGDKDSNRVYGSDFSLTEITDNSSDIDCVIFKIGPSTGWDIPRACMLLQLRNVSSITLNTQTIGRIKRNPFPMLEKHEITDKYYIYSNAPSANDELSYYHYEVKDEITDDQFLAIKIINKHSLKEEITDTIQNEIYLLLESEKGKITQQIKDFFATDSSGNIVWKKRRINANGHEIYSEVRSIFLVLKELLFLVKKNQILFSNLKTTLDRFYMDVFRSEELGNGLSTRIEYLYFAVLEFYLDDIKSIIRKNNHFVPNYDVDFSQYRPKQYVEVYSRDESLLEGDIFDMSKYLFKIKKNGEDWEKQPLDSNAEEKFVNFLNSVIAKFGDCIKIWCKNSTSSNVNGEYINKSYNVSYSYFDFIIKFNNGVNLYIEVKSENDIDIVKTEKLKEAYREYFRRPFKSSTIDDSRLVICVATMPVNRNKPIIETFYDKSIFREISEGLQFEELIQKLAYFGS